MENKRRKRRPQVIHKEVQQGSKTCICKLDEVLWLTIREYAGRPLAASVFAFAFALLGDWSTYALQRYITNVISRELENSSHAYTFSLETKYDLLKVTSYNKNR